MGGPLWRKTGAKGSWEDVCGYSDDCRQSIKDVASPMDAFLRTATIVEALEVKCS